MGEGVLSRIAASVGTPVYVYDAATIRRQYASLTRALSAAKHDIHYSVKANGNLAVLGVLRALGAGVDVVSAGELRRALRAGFTPAQIVFGGVGKTPAELEEAVRVGVRLINVESPREMGLLAEIAERLGRRVDVGIRVNPDVAVDTHPYTRTGELGMKFGIAYDAVPAVIREHRQAAQLRLVALGMHVGSQVRAADVYRRAAERLVQLVAQARRLGVETLQYLDVGGGLGVGYRGEPGLAPEAFAAAVVPAACDTGLLLLVEPGRYLVAQAGVLLTRCLYRKHSGGKEFAVVDAGMNDLIRPSLYGAEHDVAVIEPSSEAGDAERCIDVVGPVCETGDFLARDRPLRGVGPGALLAVYGAGAYGFVMSSNYNSRPRAAEVLVDGGCWGLVRERESLEDLMAAERTLEETDWRE